MPRGHTIQSGSLCTNTACVILCISTILHQIVHYSQIFKNDPEFVCIFQLVWRPAPRALHLPPALQARPPARAPSAGLPVGEPPLPDQEVPRGQHRLRRGHRHEPRPRTPLRVVARAEAPGTDNRSWNDKGHGGIEHPWEAGQKI